MCAQWTIDEVENRLTDVIKAAELGEPQFIYKAGRKEAVLVSPETWENIVTPKKPSFKEALFSIPQGDPFIDENGRKELELRDVEFCISGLRQKAVNIELVRWYSAIPEDAFFISVITIGEIQKGVCLLAKKSKKDPFALKQWFQQISTGYADKILPVTSEIDKEWGNISCAVGNTNIDNLIAATAEVHDLVVSTRNIKHFQHTGVDCINPWEKA